MTEIVPILSGTIVNPADRDVRDVQAADWSGMSERDLAVKIWLDSFTSQHTRDAYRRDFASWMEWCDSRALPIQEARRAHVHEWRNEMAGASNATIVRRLSAVSSFYDHWVTEGAITYNPGKRTKRPKVSADPVSIWLTREQAAALIGYVDGMADRRATIIVRLLAETGMRVGELCGTAVADLGESGGHHTIKIRRKGGKDQVLPLAGTTYGRITEYLDGRRDGWLLLVQSTERREKDGRMDRSYVRQLLRRVSRESGLPEEVWTHMHPHVLRHSAATVLAKAGVPPHEIQQMLGHADLRTTQRYIHHSNELDASPVYRLAALLAKE